MAKRSGYIDLSKIKKEKIEKHTFTTKDGKEVEELRYPVDIVDMKEEKVIKSGSDWVMVKDSFISEGLSKEERAKAKESGEYPDTEFLGSLFRFKSNSEQLNDNYPTEDISPEDIPF